MFKTDSRDSSTLRMNQLPVNRTFPMSSDEESTSSMSSHDRNKVPSSSLELTKNVFHKLPFCHSLDGVNLDPVRMVIAEFVGTFILMFCICAVISITELLKGAVGLLEYATTAGLTVATVIFTIGHISCAHVNPAVTISFAIFSSFPWKRVPLYIAAQLMGSVLATFVGAAVYGVETGIMTTKPIHGSSSAFWVEFIATFIVVFLAASVSYNYKTMGYLSGIVMGMAIAVAVLITAPVSGGSLNPARSLGPAIVSWDFRFVWIYTAAPLAGAIAGTLVYRLVHLEQKPAFGSESSPCSSLLGSA